jgi:hypothetical protein
MEFISLLAGGLREATPTQVDQAPLMKLSIAKIGLRADHGPAIQSLPGVVIFVE